MPKLYYEGLPSTHPFVTLWRNIHKRCYTPGHNRWASYGGKGIQVCSEWFSFKQFYLDLFPLWTAGKQLDRIDNDGHYSKENVRFVSPAENSQNRANTKMTREKALELRKVYGPGAAYQQELATRFGISSRMVRYIGENKAWK